MRIRHENNHNISNVQTKAKLNLLVESGEFSLRAAAARWCLLTAGEGLHLNHISSTVIAKKMTVVWRIEITNIEFVEGFP